MTTSSHSPKGVAPPTILQVLPALGGGGVERGTLEMADYLSRMGWNSLVASEGGRMLEQLEKSGSLHFSLPLASKNPLVMRRNIDRLVKIIKENKVDIVHARSRAPAWSAYFAAKKAKVKFVTTVHGIYGFGPFGIKKAYNRVMLKGDLIISVSEFVSRLIQREYSVPEEKIRVVHRGVDLDTFSPDKISKEQIAAVRDAWQLPAGKTVIMMPCRLSRWKGHHLLLDAVNLLENKDDIVCVFVGAMDSRSGYKKEILKYAAKLGLKQNVKIFGYIGDMAAAYMLADIVVSAATKPEAFGRTIIEAEAMGRLVIAADEGGACETVKDGLTGLLFKSRDAEDLADNLERIFEMSKREKEVMRETAQSCASTEFSTNAMCAKTVKVYEELL